MKLSGEEARNIVYDLDALWKRATKNVVEETTRWSIIKSAVFQHLPSGKFYEFWWSQGATETQDEAPFEYDDEYEPVEVVQKIVKRVIWEPKK